MRSVVVRCVIVAWPLVLAVLLVWPLWTAAGYPLARDAAFVPQQPWTPMVWGGGQVAPRAVPLDAVMAVLTALLDGAVWARVLVTGGLALAGWGAGLCVVRACRGVTDSPGALAAVLTASGLAVWNPWVVERLALGQWALVVGYAALPWLGLAVLRWNDSSVSWPRAVAPLVGWSALASLTPTGGLLALLVTASLGLGRRVRSWVPLLVAAVIQLPWVLAGFLGPAALTSDPDGVAAFAARADGTGSPLAALVGLGGIWDRASTPPTRETAWAWVSVVCVVLLVAGSAWAYRRSGRNVALPVQLGVLGGAGLILAAASSTGPGEQLMRAVVLHVPGGGLLRDSQKFLGPLALVVAVVAGWVVLRCAERWAEQRIQVWPAVLLPFLLVPDATRVVWPTWQPVQYPAEFSAVAEEVAQTPQCRMLTLPLRSYRGFSWGSGMASSDPAVRWFDCEVLVDDRLQVGDVVLEGESAEMASIVSAIEGGRDVVEVAREHDIGWLLLYTDDPMAPDVLIDGADIVVRGQQLTLYRVE